MALKRFCDWCDAKIPTYEGRRVTTAAFAGDDEEMVIRFADESDAIDLCDSCWSEARIALLDVKRERKVAV